ncbi:MAG: YkgJ family cysteine cluster protein [Nitrospirae bacterium]|nr:MAG: YkgJ family cysteine cluster protein [Nitrospirota bacterium]
MNGTPQKGCSRCGRCCKSHTPSLHKGDISLIKGGVLPLNSLYTIRKGEPVNHNIEGKVLFIDTELVKIKESRKTGYCLFYNLIDSSCSIYQHRPAQCRFFECWNPEKFKILFNSPKLTRTDIVTDKTMLELMKAHEQRVPCGRFYELLNTEKPSEDKESEIVEMINYDQHFRDFLIKQSLLDPEEMDFYFGRSLIKGMQALGFSLEGSKEDGFLLIGGSNG